MGFDYQVVRVKKLILIVFKKHKIGNVGIKAHVGEEQFSKIIRTELSSASIEPRISAISVSCFTTFSSDSSEMFNLPFVGVVIDFWTLII